uniref:Stromal cell-derived factor 1 n=3 Tax=Cyprinus carpio TaxID=7962 RepID=A0A9J8B0B9_CYPCA
MRAVGGEGPAPPPPERGGSVSLWSSVLTLRRALRRHTELWKLAVTDKSHTHTLGMDSKVLALVALLTVVIWSPEADAKPISLVERCWCRSTLNTVPQRSIREIKFLHTPSCPFQVIAKLKNNREVCINPKTKWLQQYLKNAISKIKKKRSK